MTPLESRLVEIFSGFKRFYTKYLSNKYLTVVILFFVWMLFFDSNNIIRQVQRKRQINKLNKEIQYYTKELEQTKIEEKALKRSDKYFEKFVRENYLLKRKNEVLFIFTEDPQS